MKTWFFNGTRILWMIDHCDNPTLHLNLETSEVFLKNKNSFRKLSFYFESKKYNNIESKIVSTYVL
jgi:hypothetical protein